MSVDNGAPHGAPHGPPHEAPSSPKPHSESSMSTEAMERAADTISAAIESFECQFAHREQHKAGEPRQGRHGLMFPQRAPETLDVGSQDGSRTAAGSVIDPELFIRPASADSYYSTPSSPAAGELSPSAVSLPGYLPGYFPGRSNSVKLETPMERRRRSEPPGSDFFVADIQPQGAGEWATTSDSTPTLAGSLSRKSRRLSYVPSGYHTDTSDVIDHFDTAKSSFNGRVRAASVHLPASELQRFPAPPRVHAVELPRPRTSAAYVDLFEAADRLRAVKESQIVSRPMSYPVANDPKAPSSIQIGGFTYIRQVPDLYPATEMPEKPEEPPAHRKGSPGGPPMSLGHEIAFFSIIALAQVLMLSGVSQAMVPAEVIGDTFHVRAPADLAWFSASYALTSGTFVLPAGRLGDLFGHKKIFIIGFLWFAVWSVVTGFAGRVQDAGANGVIYFDICRAIQGIGPSLLVPNGQAMLGRAYAPGPRKALVMSLFGAAAPLGFVCGGVFASLFAQLMTWPWAFWVLGMACLVLSVASYFILPPTGETKKSTTDSIWLQLDLAGMFFGVAGLVLFNFAWNQAPVAGWETPYTYFMLIISIIFLGVFIYVELNATYPLLPISAMTARTNYVLGCVALGWGGFSIWVFYYIQVLEVLRGWSPLLTAASLAPGPVTGLIASLIVAGFMAKIGPHWIMVLSMCAFAVGGLFMATAPVDQIYWINTFLSVFIMPFGMDMSNPAASLLLSNSVSKEHQGIAASLVVTVVCYSISTFLGFAATVEVEVRKNGADVLEGFRAAQYFGVGVGVLGVCISLAYLWTTYREKRQEAAAALIPPKV